MRRFYATDYVARHKTAAVLTMLKDRDGNLLTGWQPGGRSTSKMGCVETMKVWAVEPPLLDEIKEVLEDLGTGIGCDSKHFAYYDRR